jgi:hypothetical protein
MLNVRHTSTANFTGSELIISALSSLSSLKQKKNNNVNQPTQQNLFKTDMKENSIFTGFVGYY